MMVASEAKDYQHLWGVLDQGLKQLGYSREGLNVELFASDKAHVLDPYCSIAQNCCYKFYRSFSEVGKALTRWPWNVPL